MPLSLRSSSFCFLACLCSSGWVAAQTINQTNLTPPLYDIGEAFYLTSNCFIKDVYGAKFPSSFLGSSSNLTIFGKQRSLTFSQCHAPVKEGASLISAAEALTLSHLSKLVLNENISIGKHGLISGKDITITSSKAVTVTNNRTPYTPVVTESVPTSVTVNCFCGSAVHTTTSLNITKIRNQITFGSNSGNFGAALLNDTNASCNIENNSAAISFSQNFAACGGGAIYDGTVTFKNNSGPIALLGNTAAKGLQSKTPNPAKPIGSGCGGAICVPTKSVSFVDNTGGCNISSNLAQNDGGAIYATTCTFANTSPTYITKNSAKENGGAICAKALTVNAQGPMVFFNNRAQKGGAVYISPTVGNTSDPATSTLSLTAKSGDMVFIGNMLDGRPGVRNAIHMEGDSKVTALNASGLSNLIFHDPITNTGPTNNGKSLNTITVNSPGYSGSVKFTSETLTISEKLNPANTTSSLFGKVVIEDGQLIVTNNAKLKVLGLTAETGRLTLGSGSGIELLSRTNSNPTPDNFTISKLGCDIHSYLNPDYSPAQVHSGTKSVTVSGSLDIVSEDSAELYDNPLLQESLSFPFANFRANSNGPTKDNFTEGPIDVPEHYGYQGVWSSSWTTPLLAPTPNGGIPSGTSNQTLYVVWRPESTHRAPYILDPERRGEIVSNTLWTSFLATQVFSEALEENFLNRNEGVLVSAKAIGNYIRQPIHKSHEGFKGRYGGYQASIGINYPDEASIGLAFGQLYGQVKSKPYDTHSTEQISVFAFFGKFLLATENTATNISWEAAYGYAVNHIKTNYLNPITQRTRKSKGRWHNNTYYAAVSVEHPFLTWCTLTRKVAHDFDFSGFISAEFMGGWQNAFAEQGYLPRSFSRGRGHNIALPIGFTSEWHTPFKKAPSTLTLKLAYKPDIYRVNPHNVVTILANNESIPVTGAFISRNGFYLQVHDSVELSQHTTGFVDYVFDSKKSYASHRVITGLQGTF
ncbi:polymorphic outer membrane protein 6H (pmp6H) [Chlamydia abortus LLG]|uniref:polymorphic outer membrane protein middle domain-containing protein n=1 Tax=Chlamydia abortus TaxID=83555 RepID=UPI00029CBDD9|nr:polymorphic outer membrane protein middle domain-containing protein [Chlamydia abortus]EGK69048.1 polymorphic outer membrane protein 6H (pmp6H) [Chlamydia abortus LLG]SFW03800.1 polymorphic outer membrane protein H family protein [Chlamydia abortus]